MHIIVLVLTLFLAPVDGKAPVKIITQAAPDSPDNEKACPVAGAYYKQLIEQNKQARDVEYGCFVVADAKDTQA